MKMRLLQLTSDNPKFRTLTFNSGLNIVAGLQLSDEERQSINGIGKSMSLNLIHYIFGASFKSVNEKKLLDFLSKYGIFELVLVHKGKEYTIKKDFAKTDFYINEKKITQSNYPDELKSIFLPENYPLKFKQTFNCFARRYHTEVGYYSNVLSQQGQLATDFYQKFANLFLLGIDMNLVNERRKIKTQLSKLEKATTTVSEYEALLDKTNINDLIDEINRLKDERDNFIIAQNYDGIKREADDLTVEMNQLRNETYSIEKKLMHKESSIKNSENINIDVEVIKDIYEEAQFFFEDKIIIRLNEAQAFHNKLILNRKNRITTEIKELRLKIEELSSVFKKVAIKRDNIIKSLDNTGALEEYNTILDRIKSLEAEQKDLEKYEHILSEFKKEKSELDVENALIKQKSIIYLEQNHKHFASIEAEFRKLVKRFYDNTGGTLKIIETGDAQYLFDIQTHIPKEGSQGVGEVKIFCYDILLSLLNKDLLGFLAHDGYVFSEMDPRQKSLIFKIALELTQQNDFQYFVNIGENSLNEILDDSEKYHILTDEDKENIRKSIILELYDKDPKNWLFGESFD